MTRGAVVTAWHSPPRQTSPIQTPGMFHHNPKASALENFNPNHRNGYHVTNRAPITINQSSVLVQMSSNHVTQRSTNHLRAHFSSQNFLQISFIGKLVDVIGCQLGPSELVISGLIACQTCWTRPVVPVIRCSIGRQKMRTRDTSARAAKSRHYRPTRSEAFQRCVSRITASLHPRRQCTR
jgi:hypothetical protein